MVETGGIRNLDEKNIKTKAVVIWKVIIHPLGTSPACSPSHRAGSEELGEKDGVMGSVFLAPLVSFGSCGTQASGTIHSFCVLVTLPFSSQMF